MDKNTEVMSIGEIMVESIFNIDREPETNSTIIVENASNLITFGGAAINVAWNLGYVGKSVSLIAPVTNIFAETLSTELRDSKVDTSHLVISRGKTDHLYTLLFPNGHRSIYELGEIPSTFEKTVLNLLKKCKVIVINGGRHKSIREIYQNVINKFQQKIIIFNPSYAVYEYSNSELNNLMQGSDICFLNEDEFNFVRKRLKTTKFKYFPRLALVKTKSGKGATMFSTDRQHHYDDVVERPGVFLGAGDACVAGFITGILDKVSLEASLYRGMYLSSLVVKNEKIRATITSKDAIQLRKII